MWGQFLWFSAALAGPLPGEPRGTDASGFAFLDQDLLTVQTKETFEWTYVVGSEGFPVGSAVQIDDPVFHGMRWSKWGDLLTFDDLFAIPSQTCEPQTDNGSRASYGMVSAYATDSAGSVLGGVTLSIARSNCVGLCNKSIHEEAWTTVTLDSGTLSAGDLIHVVHGDVEGCFAACSEAGIKDCSSCADCGFEAPDRSFRHVYWKASECIGDAPCEALSPVSFTVGPQEAGSMLVTAPSMVSTGDTFTLKVAVLDAYGNPVDNESRGISVNTEQNGNALPMSISEEAYTLRPVDGGWHDFAVQLTEPGVYRLQVDSAGLPSTRSNPILVSDTAPAHNIYWGDIHVHHGYTWVEDGQRRDYNHDYGRDVVGLDVVSESIKAEGIEIDVDALWAELQDTCTAYTIPNEYLVMLGFEWIGDVAANAACGDADKCSDGHHNIYYGSCDGPLGTLDASQINSVDDPKLGLWAWLDRVRDVQGLEAVSIPHAMRWTEFKFDSFYVTDAEPGYPGTQTLVEVISEWGDGTGNPNDDGSVQDMMRRGHRLGWIGGSDNHDGWMGNPYARQDLDASSSGGLGAFLAPTLTRSSVFEAMQARRTYATTGPRAIMLFTARELGESYPQGSELIATAPSLQWMFYGTAPINSLQLLRLDVDATSPEPEIVRQLSDPGGLDSAGNIDLIASEAWDGASDVLFWIEVRQKDQEKIWSSPIWLTTDCDRLSLGALDPQGLCGPQDTGDPVDTGNRTGDGDSGGGSDSGPAPVQLRCSCATGATPATTGLLAMLLGLAATRRRRG